MNIQSTYNKLAQAKGRLGVLTDQRDNLQAAMEATEKELKASDEALAAVLAAAKVTQAELERSLATVVSEALADVFPDPYKFRMEFVNRRNNTEVDLIFDRDGNRTRPLKDSGFGAADIASFALRVSFILMSKNRKLLIIDEPFRQLSEGYRGVAATMAKSLAESLGIQIILVTHISEFTPDYLVKMESGESVCRKH